MVETLEDAPVTTEPLDEQKPLIYSFWVGAFILKGSTAPRILADVVKFGLIAFTTVALAMLVQSFWDVRLSVPFSLFSAAGAVLGLLLVLRTNAGYDRWWEARKLWGGIVNQSRNLAIIGSAYGPEDGEWRNQFIRWVAVLPHVIRCSLRDERKLPEVITLIGPTNTARIIESQHMPTMVGTVLAQKLREGRAAGMSQYALRTAEEERSMIFNHLGGCERIRNTPLAKCSAILVRQFIFIFLVSLPFALMSEFQDARFLTSTLWEGFNDGLFLIPLFIMLLATPLLSLDRIGMELQNPFDTRRIDHLPLDAICHTIELNLRDILKNDAFANKEGSDLDSPQIDPALLAKIKKGSARDTLIS